MDTMNRFESPLFCNRGVLDMVLESLRLLVLSRFQNQGFRLTLCPTRRMRRTVRTLYKPRFAFLPVAVKPLVACPQRNTVAPTQRPNACPRQQGKPYPLFLQFHRRPRLPRHPAPLTNKMPTLKCLPCPRTCVQDVPGLNSGRGAKNGSPRPLAGEGLGERAGRGNVHDAMMQTKMLQNRAIPPPRNRRIPRVRAPLRRARKISALPHCPQPRRPPGSRHC